tara:strand:- start:136 stop:381 length:246 start_codon:yes stop_codon:yes gene_type:complete
VKSLQAEIQLQQRAIIPSINLRQAAHLRFQLTSKFLFSISLSLEEAVVVTILVVEAGLVDLETAPLVKIQVAVVRLKLHYF